MVLGTLGLCILDCVMLEDQVLPSWDLPSGSWVTVCWGVRPGMNIPSLMAPYRLTVPESLGVRKSTWDPKNASGGPEG